jgi:cytochrome c
LTGKEEDGAYVLTATYFDKGVDKIPALSSSSAVILRSGMLSANHADELNVARKINNQGRWALENVRNGSYAVYKNLDLSGVKKATLMAFIREGNSGGDIEVHLDSPDGKLVGKVTASKPGLSALPTKMQTETGYHDIYIVFKNPQAIENSMFYFGGIRLEN